MGFRNSIQKAVWKDVSLMYVPLDKSKWYYINAEGWWNEKPMRIGESPPAQPEGET
jgi:hypothetical protein